MKNTQFDGGYMSQSKGDGCPLTAMIKYLIMVLSKEEIIYKYTHK